MKYGQFKNEFQNKLDSIIEDNGIFFAFGKDQFFENKKYDEKHYNLGGGMFCPSSTYEKYNKELEEVINDFERESIEKFSSIEIIIYELGNHEYCITYDLEDTKIALSDYDFSDEQYRAAIKQYLEEVEA